jgi:hypothetical protein
MIPAKEAKEITDRVNYNRDKDNVFLFLAGIHLRIAETVVRDKGKYSFYILIPKEVQSQQAIKMIYDSLKSDGYSIRKDSTLVWEIGWK